MPGVPFNSCSIGVATACDTVSALAPGYDADIFTTGGVICGYWSMGSISSPINPNITISMERTMENTGLSMKKLIFISLFFFYAGVNFYFNSWRQFVSPFGNDGFARH